MLGTLENWAGTYPLAAAGLLAAGIVLLLLGGHWLVNGSVSIARRLGLSTLLIGLTLVAFGTSSPELFFNVIAAASGHGELSFGNIVGSNIANLGLILGVAAILTPLVVHSRVLSIELPLLVLISGGVVALGFVPPSDQRGFDRFEGLILLLVFALFMFAWYRMGRREAADPLVVELGEEAEEEKLFSMPVAWMLVGLGLVALTSGGKLAEIGAVGAAKLMNLSEALIGLTIVAVATSLPELATSVIAVRKGHADLAIGNVVGSNIFNLLLVLALTAIVSPVAMPLPGGVFDLAAMALLTLLLLPMAFTNHSRITRWEGAILLALYAGYMTFRVVREI